MRRKLDGVHGCSVSSARCHAKYRLIRNGLLKEDERYPLDEAIKRAGL